MMRMLLVAGVLMTIVLVLLGYGLFGFVLPGTMAFQVILMSPHQRRQLLGTGRWGGRG